MCSEKMTEKKNYVLIGCLCAVGCEVLYGMSFMFSKQATNLADTSALLGWRFLVAFIAMTLLAITGVMKVDLKGKDLKPAIIVAIFCPCIYFVGETVGISNTTSSESGIFIACIPVVSLIASALILKKVPTKLQVTGILITLFGVILTVVAVGITSSLSVIGYMALVVAVISYSMYCVFVDKASGLSGAEITYVMIIAGAVVFAVYALAEAFAKGSVNELLTLPFRESSFLIAILYQGIGCSIFAFFLSNLAIARIGVNKTSSFVGITTVVAIISGALFMRENLTALQLAGAAVILIGVYVANSEKQQGNT